MTTMFGTMQVHAAAIEWPDDYAEPTVILTATLEELHTSIRENIERECAGWAKFDDRRCRAIGEYITGEGKTIEDYTTWHEKLHEYDGTPWVTESEHTIEIR